MHVKYFKVPKESILQMSLCCRKELWLSVAGSGAGLPGSPSSVIAKFAVVDVVESLAPVTLGVGLAVFRAHLALGGNGRT